MKVTVGDVEFVLYPRDMVCMGSLGSGVHGTVDRMKHQPTGIIMAVKV